MDARAHEFMPRTLLESQFAALEELGADEAHVLGDITQSLELLVESIARQLDAKTDDATCEGAETASVVPVG